MLTSQMSALGSSFWLRIKAHQQGLESGQQRFPLDWGHGCHLVTTARGFPEGEASSIGRWRQSK